MWQNPEIALALHRARAAETRRRPRNLRALAARPAAPGLALRPSPAAGAR